MPDTSFSGSSPRAPSSPVPFSRFAFLSWLVLLEVLLLMPGVGVTPTGTPVNIFAWIPPSSSLTDVLANLFAFGVLGGLQALSMIPSRKTHILLETLLLAAVLSVAAETFQMFLPGRVPSGIDVLVDTLASPLGAASTLLLLERVKGPVHFPVT